MQNPIFHGDLVTGSRILYTPTLFAKTSLLHIQEIGFLQANKPHITKRTQLDSYLFFIVSSGSGELFYDGVLYPLHEGDCIFIDCKKEYYHETSDNLWSLSWIHFNGNNLDNIFDKHINRLNSPVFTPTSITPFNTLFESLYDITKGDSRIRDIEINAKLSELLVLLFNESYQVSTDEPRYRKVDAETIKEYIDNNYKQKITLEKLSERFFINKYYLTRLFKNRYGSSINNYILNLRITQAKQELRFTNKPISNIGIDCGIGPLYYFSRVFTRIEGVSPNKYRKTWNSSK